MSGWLVEIRFLYEVSIRYSMKGVNGMNRLHVTKIKARHPMLRYLIKYYWIMKSDNPVVVNHKLLPVNNIDIIINFSSSIKYSSKNKMEIVTTKAHFNGIRDSHLIINQVGKLDVIGISFFPAGLYPLIKVPLYEYKNMTIELDTLINGFTSQIEENSKKANETIDKIDIIEQVLMDIIDTKFIPESKLLQILNDFHANIGNYSINQFCYQYGINQRQLERYFKKYIGTSPKSFQRLNRYQKTMNMVLNNRIIDLTTLAYENDYYDQNHFIKEFKSFTGCTPSRFINEKKSVKEIILNN